MNSVEMKFEGVPEAGQKRSQMLAKVWPNFGQDLMLPIFSKMLPNIVKLLLFFLQNVARLLL